MNGNYAKAKKNADLLVANVAPHVKEMPPLEGFMTIPMAVDVRFHQWNDILTMPRPDPDLKITTVLAFRPWYGAGGNR